MCFTVCIYCNEMRMLFLHNAAKNMNSFAHIALLAVAVAAVVTKSACSYRSLKSVKRIA